MVLCLLGAGPIINSHDNQLKKNVYPLNYTRDTTEAVTESSILSITEIMPITKYSRKRQPQWRESDCLAQKEGLRHAVHSVNGDVYTGEWADNKKCGECSRSSWKGMLIGIHGFFSNRMRKLCFCLY